MGTDMKITESRECTDIVRADWGQTVCGTQINAKKQCEHERWRVSLLRFCFCGSMGGTSGTSVHWECWLKFIGSGWFVQILTSTFVGAEMIIAFPLRSHLLLSSCSWREEVRWIISAHRGGTAFTHTHILSFRLYMSHVRKMSFNFHLFGRKEHSKSAKKNNSRQQQTPVTFTVEEMCL